MEGEPEVVRWSVLLISVGEVSGDKVPTGRGEGVIRNKCAPKMAKCCPEESGNLTVIEKVGDGLIRIVRKG